MSQEIKRQLGNLPESSVVAFTDKVRALWDDVTIEYLSKLSDSMPNRINAVIQMKENMTKY